MIYKIIMKSFKCPVHKFIRIEPFALEIIDTVEFQRLRFIRQLGVCHYVYPSASHTRFEHSLGVYNLVGKLFTCLLENQPDLQIPRRDIQLIKIAGLIHDIGHVCFSHSFDNHIRQKLDVHVDEHEDRGVQLFRHMVKKYKLPFLEKEVDLICNIILGKFDSNYPKYYFEIVANSSTHLDVDKLDYLLRDSYHLGFQLGFQYDYLFHKMRIIDNQICYNKKAAYTIYSIFNARYKLHKEVYQHSAVSQIDAMICDAIIQEKETLKLNQMFGNNNFDWVKLTDDYIYVSLALSNNNILSRINKRNLYHTISKDETSKIDKKQFIVSEKTLGFVNKNVNPLCQICFFDKKNTNQLCKMKMNEITNLMPLNFTETHIQYISKN